ncbi:MAG: ferritin [Cyclobacteriaceae bacterium]
MRKNIAISSEIEELLNKQVVLEASASTNYLAMASWCDGKGYSNAATYFYEQSDEERSHMLKVFHYINDVGGEAAAAKVTDIQADFVSLRDVFETALENEILVSKAINKIVEVTKKDKDYSTEQFMQWFVAEQREEEMIARRAVELFEMLGDDKLALFMIDERIANLKKSVAPDAGAEQA